MATVSYWTNRGKYLLATADFDAIDFRAALIKAEVVEATGEEYNTLSQFIAASNEADCTGYARATLSGISVTEQDSSSDNAIVTWSNISWGALGGASNCAIAQVVIYRHNASDSSAEAIAVLGGSSLAFTTNGSTVTSSGLQLTIA